MTTVFSQSFFQKAVFILWSIWAVSCAHSPDVLNSRSFPAPKEKVWEVLVAVFKSYPLKTIDEDKGYIETGELKASHFWKPPHRSRENFTGYSSMIRVRLSYHRPISHVYIDKKVYKQKGFISSKQEVPSDLLEESILLYRIGRELSIRSRLDKLQ